MQEFYFEKLKNHVMVESVISTFWIDIECMQGISFSFEHWKLYVFRLVVGS